MRILFSIITCALLACCAIQSPQAGPVGFRLPAKAFVNPASISGLKLWLDASQITGLSDGDSVTNWFDLSGNTNDFSQSTASRRPLYKTAVQNGLPGVLGDGVDDRLESASVDWSAYDKATIFCVYKNPTATADEIIYERSADVNANNGAWILFNDAANVISAAKTPTGVAYSSVNNAFANGVVVTKIDLALPSNALTAKLNGSDFSGRAFDGNGGNFGNYANYLFQRAGGVAPMNGYILEMGVYMGEIGDAARAQLTTYLRNKWGY